MAGQIAQALLAIVNQPQHRQEASKFLSTCEEQDTTFPLQLLEIFANPQAAIAAAGGAASDPIPAEHLLRRATNKRRL